MATRALLGQVLGLMFVASSCRAATLLSEDFEDNVLDPRISISTVGTFISPPGIKSFSSIEGNKAFGFGRSTNLVNSFNNYVTWLTITLDVPTYVSSISFGEMEAFDNWGSGGAVYADGAAVSPSLTLGRLPYNDRRADTVPSFYEFAVDRRVSQLTFKVDDITQLSEVYVDRIVVSSVPEPESGALLIAGMGLVGLAVRRARRTG